MNMVKITDERILCSLALPAPLSHTWNLNACKLWEEGAGTLHKLTKRAQNRLYSPFLPTWLGDGSIATHCFQIAYRSMACPAVHRIGIALMGVLRSAGGGSFLLLLLLLFTLSKITPWTCCWDCQTVSSSLCFRGPNKYCPLLCGHKWCADYIISSPDAVPTEFLFLPLHLKWKALVLVALWHLFLEQANYRNHHIPQGGRGSTQGVLYILKGL